MLGGGYLLSLPECLLLWSLSPPLEKWGDLLRVYLMLSLSPQDGLLLELALCGVTFSGLELGPMNTQLAGAAAGQTQSPAISWSFSAFALLSLVRTMLYSDLNTLIIFICLNPKR